LWACYVEKAVAIHCGGWDKIDGGQCTHGWALLTGCKHQYTIYRAENGNYECYGLYDSSKKQWMMLANSPHDGPKQVTQIPWPEVGGGGDTALSSNELFDRMCAWDKQNYIIGAGTKSTASGSDSTSTDGIYDNHAYSVITCVKNVADSGFDLVKVRNPHGSGEFSSGMWDDDGPGWTKYPKVKEALNPNLSKDGTFWMTSEEFFRYFPTIYLSASDMSKFKED
jgi:hypothetical protein